MQRQIIAMGGGGFSMEPDNPLLDDYILAQSNRECPNICFIGTASGDSEDYINRFYAAFNDQPCTPAHLPLFKDYPRDVEGFLMDQDIIYVGGGNTRNMLVIWRTWGVDRILKKAYEGGTILSGLSAGAICWFEQGLTDSTPEGLTTLPCLSLLNGSNCPHFDGEAERQEVYKHKIVSGEMLPGIACDDGVALHFVNEELEKVVSSRKQGGAYRFTLEQGMLREEILAPVRLGGDVGS
ncbi:Type 1 glutamine amidotransferase-like domain-containing protein [Flavilitoribacter nigricans]|uniref:Peptidase E n=1 Tax=Flavilitoribacter nigricans (strain ATCC 23147 / DSM 23189 / NBRC 102662 / NCIMB 1420 / SS-2) TaxID=1122177 RepID=A0A2D0N497_FLAN2|nr:peptidase E [Flavilitoribacter nigricans]PHN03267.1 peptidase E [Flavilitoribacter nigricans DSM 23189 = NBRC 102662]